MHYNQLKVVKILKNYIKIKRFRLFKKFKFYNNKIVENNIILIFFIKKTGFYWIKGDCSPNPLRGNKIII
jgi:hypothetical protein